MVHSPPLPAALPPAPPAGELIPFPARLAAAAALPDVAILAGHLRPSSRAMYARDIAAYLAWCAAVALPPVDSSSLARWCAHLAEQTALSPHTINRMLAAVKRLVKEAAVQGYLDRDQAAGFADIVGVRPLALKERLKAHARTLITPAQMRQLCASPDPSTLLGRRDRALLHTLASSGVRVSEAVGLRPEAIQAVAGSYVVHVCGKTDLEPREAPLSAEAYQAIQTWLAARPLASPYVFTSFAGRGARPLATPLTAVAAWRVVQKYAQACDLPFIKPHDFRRFVGTWLTERAGIRAAQKALGHKSIVTTARYDLNRLAPGLTDGLY